MPRRGLPPLRHELVSVTHSTDGSSHQWECRCGVKGITFTNADEAFRQHKEEAVE